MKDNIQEHRMTSFTKDFSKKVPKIVFILNKMTMKMVKIMHIIQIWPIVWSSNRKTNRCRSLSITNHHLEITQTMVMKAKRSLSWNGESALLYKRVNMLWKSIKSTSQGEVIIKILRKRHESEFLTNIWF